MAAVVGLAWRQWTVCGYLSVCERYLRLFTAVPVATLVYPAPSSLYRSSCFSWCSSSTRSNGAFGPSALQLLHWRASAVGAFAIAADLGGDLVGGAWMTLVGALCGPCSPRLPGYCGPLPAFLEFPRWSAVSDASTPPSCPRCRSRSSTPPSASSSWSCSVPQLLGCGPGFISVRLRFWSGLGCGPPAPLAVGGSGASVLR